MNKVNISQDDFKVLQDYAKLSPKVTKLSKERKAILDGAFSGKYHNEAELLIAVHGKGLMCEAKKNDSVSTSWKRMAEKHIKNLKRILPSYQGISSRFVTVFG